jgi:hypothetical protein
MAATAKNQRNSSKTQPNPIRLCGYLRENAREATEKLESGADNGRQTGSY